MLAEHSSTPRSYPLTRAQLLLWTGQQLQSDAPLYNMIIAFRISTSIDVARFSAAFECLVDTTDALRAYVTNSDGEPRQCFSDAGVIRLELVDFSTFSDPDSEYRAWLDARRMHRFDLRRCSYDSALIKLAANDFIWYFNQHHLFTDAWSMSVLFKRLAAIYHATQSEHRSPYETLPQFRDYLEQTPSTTVATRLLKARQYWSERYSPVNPSRLYRPRPNELSGRTLRMPCQLGHQRSSDLRDLALRAPYRAFTAELALFRLFSTVLFACLYRLTGEAKQSIGAPVHNRTSPRLKSIAGMFIELFPMSVEVQAQDSFESLHGKVTASVQALLLHAVPDASGSETGGAFDVVLNFITAGFGTFDGSPATCEWVHPDHGDRGHVLRLQVHDFDQNGDFQLLFDVANDCASEQEQAALAEHFLTLLDAFIEDPHQIIDHVALLSTTRTDELLTATLPATCPPSEANVIELFQRQVARWPEAIAVIEGDNTLSYQALDDRSTKLSLILRTEGLVRGQTAAIALPRSLDAVVAILAVLKSGAAYLPVDLDYPVSRITYLIEDSGSTLVVVNAVTQLKVTGTKARLLHIETIAERVEAMGPDVDAAPERGDAAYLIYTSGSTGQPKGVVIEHGSLGNYLQWAAREYDRGERRSFPLFSSLSFDLTVTSLFVPLISGGRLIVYPARNDEHGMLIRRVVADNLVDVIKLTPVHLNLIRDMDFSNSRIRTLVVGGEDFKSGLARAIHRRFAGAVDIYNEYGPTEGTVACTRHLYDPQQDSSASVPIGKTIDNLRVYVLDAHSNLTPRGGLGELCIGGVGVARGYHDKPDLTSQRFVPDPFLAGGRMYRTGDIAYWDSVNILHYLGRRDQQVKIHGVRIETAEVEAALSAHPAIKHCAVDTLSRELQTPDTELFCQRCGLEARHPDARLDNEKVCSVCRGYEDEENLARAYFGRRADLRRVIERVKAEAKGSQDCLMLLSGGKDSTFALCQIVAMGLNPLVFTLDNGFISEGAKANARRVVDKFGLELVVGATPAMNEIFVDSLNRFSNVCNGCFKTIYTLSMNLARERGIKFIFTGLSRGQIFETRLAGLFQQNVRDPAAADEIIMAARKAYHRMNDAVSRCLDVSIFSDDRVFEEIEFVDFYRYSDATLEEIMGYLAKQAPWIRPADTGRSTNCLINDVGIHVHKTERQFHNYAMPYSWDVRLGHKERDAARDELNDAIDLARVTDILQQIGYDPEEAVKAYAEEARLTAWYVAERELSVSELREWLGARLPAEYIPSNYVAMEALPLTPNDKVDRSMLPIPNDARPVLASEFALAANATEQALVEIWQDVLGVKEIGVHDNFFGLGGDSILNIQIVTRAQAAHIALSPQQIFDCPTIAELANVVGHETILAAEQGTMTGEVPLLPAQQAYFECYPDGKQPLSQIAVFTLAAGCPLELLTEVLRAVVAHHDALTCTFVRNPDGHWRQQVSTGSSAAVAITIDTLDVSAFDTHEKERTIARRSAQMSNAMDIGSGPLVRALVLYSTPGTAAQLLVVIHHLVVDGVSWWILRDDFNRALQQRRAGQAVALPAKTHSIRQWADALAEYARSPQLLGERPYWAAQTNSAGADLVRAPSGDTQDEHGRASQRLWLDTGLTHALLHDVPPRYKVAMAEALIFTIGDAIAQCGSLSRLTLAIDGHGREAVVEGLNLLRTVGRFTTVHPVMLQFDPHTERFSKLRLVKEQLRAAPNHGIGYSIYRYLSHKRQSSSLADPVGWPSILFNYLGQWDSQRADGAAITFACPIALHRGQLAQSEYALEINAVVFEGRLAIDFDFDHQVYSMDSISSVLSSVRADLTQLVADTSAATAVAVTPADFPQASLSQADLNDIMAQFSEEED